MKEVATRSVLAKFVAEVLPEWCEVYVFSAKVPVICPGMCGGE